VAVVRGVAGVMSEVLSFRLSKENSREAKALSILKMWREEGYTIRHTLTVAILKLDSDHEPPANMFAENEILKALNDILQYLPIPKNVEHPNPKQQVSEKFMASLKLSVKPGLKFK